MYLISEKKLKIYYLHMIIPDMSYSIADTAPKEDSKIMERK